MASESAQQTLTAEGNDSSLISQTENSEPNRSNDDSLRLMKARVRLEEAKGTLAPGTAEALTLSEVSALQRQQNSDISASATPFPLITRHKSKILDLSALMTVAEPEVRYDPAELEKRLWKTPLRWITRNVQLFIPFAKFLSQLLFDIQRGEEKTMRRERAKQLNEIIASLGPAIIKGGQALASRPDVLPAEYLEELQKLQDRIPPFPMEQAIQSIEEELQRPFSEVFELVEPEPVAAASIGMVLKCRLVVNGDLVAVKVQRPGCENIIELDLYVMRFYASILTDFLAKLGRNIDLVGVIDDFGELIYREIDYTAEATNARRFADFYATIPDVFIPRIYPDLCSRKLLTMEWVDGVRLVEGDKLKAMGLNPERLVDTLVQCSLRQMLENGFFHCDPHAGNLLATEEGKLCYLDFGMMSYVEPHQRYAIIEAVVHLVNRDFTALALLYKRMGFIPVDEDVRPIVVALEGALPDVLDASVGELNFKNVVNKLGDIMYEFPFSLPPFYIAIIRCLGVLEGVAIQVDRNFRIINDAYPYISSRLLTDESPELQSALEQLLFKESDPRWDRLEQLLTQASDTQDYDVTDAMEKLVVYLLSDRGTVIRRKLTEQLLEGLDDFDEAGTGVIGQLVTSQNLPDPSEVDSPRVAAAIRFANSLQRSRGFDSQKIIDLGQKLLREPNIQQNTGEVALVLAERSINRRIRSFFGLEPRRFRRQGE